MINYYLEHYDIKYVIDKGFNYYNCIWSADKFSII